MWWKHCTRCGTLTIRRKTGFYGYDEDKGIPLYRGEVVCPNKRWWNDHTRIKEFQGSVMALPLDEWEEIERRGGARNG